MKNRRRSSAKLFVKKYANREHIEVITRAFLTEPNLDDICYSDVADMLFYLNEQYEKFEDLQSFLNCKEYRECVKKHPESVMLTMLCTIYEGAYWTTLHDYYGSYRRNTRLENWYALLTRIGYKMSSDERKLLSVLTNVSEASAMNDTKLKEIEEQLETIYDELTIFKGRYIDEDNEDNIDEALSGIQQAIDAVSCLRSEL